VGAQCRAADGRAVLRRRGTRRVRLVEVPVVQRAPVLAACLEAGRRRSGDSAAREQARWYFGLEDPPTQERLAGPAPRYPAFCVTGTGNEHGDTPVREIASGVLCVGPWGRTQTNVHLVRGATGWLLVAAAGPATPTGSRPRQRRHSRVRRGRPVLVSGSSASRRDADRPRRPRRHSRGRRADDRWVVLPVMRAMGRRRREALLARNTLGDAATAQRPGEPILGLPGWEVIATPGHTPGHVSLLRPGDRVLRAGDVLVNLRLNSARGLLRQQPGLSGPPRYATWSPSQAVASIHKLAALSPTLPGPGHGHPLTGPDTPRLVRAFAATLDTRAPSLDNDTGGAS
jgi:hypothetical protein